MPHRELAGVRQTIGLHEPLHADAIAISDFGEGVPILDGDGSAPSAGPAGASTAGTPSPWDYQALPHRELAGVRQTIGLHQPLQADAIAIGNFGQGVALFDHHVGEGCTG